MTPCAISLENHERKKLLYEGRTRPGDRAGKRVWPYEKCVRPLLSVFLKTSESEHSDGEFYYPGEMSDVEMLQLPTRNEATDCTLLE